jgi:N-acetylmuramoyl-L-alanine amidase
MNLFSITRYVKHICLGAFILIPTLIFPSALSQLSTHPDTTLSFKGKRVHLATPIVSHQNHMLLPIRDILKQFNGSLTYLRKENAYQLTIKARNISCLIIPSSKEIWVNNTHRFLSTQALFYENRLYLPIEDFFALIGYATDISDKRITITPDTNFKATSLSSKKASTKSFTSTSQLKVLPDLYKLPKFNNKTPFFLKLNDHIYPLKNAFLYQDNTLFLALSDTLKKEGYALSYEPNTVTIRKHGNSYRFSTTSRTVHMVIDGKSISKTISHPVINNDNTFYYPFKSFLSTLNLSINWDSKHRILTVLSTLNQVQWVRTSQLDYLKLYFSNPHKSLFVSSLPAKNGFSVDLPNTMSLLKKNHIQINNAVLSHLNVKKEDKTTSKIELYLKGSSFSPQIQETDYGAKISFYPKLTDIKSIKKGKHRIVQVFSTGPISHKVSYTTKPHRVIIDIDNTLSGLPQIIRTPYRPYKRVRSSQFSKNPPKSRIVFDFPQATKLISSKTKGHVLELTFLNSPKKQTISKAKPQKPLSNKVIFVDAGHGGSDPGAVGSNLHYEKKYTLDIAKKLKELLEAEGAFVILSRDRDEKVSLRRRSSQANANKADIMVSIHINSFLKSYAHGSETYYYKYKDKKLASAIQREMSRSLGLKNNGIKRAKLYVLSHSTMPAALVEPLFMTNPKEMAKLKQPAFRQKIALGVKKGIVRYFRSQ